MSYCSSRRWLAPLALAATAAALFATVTRGGEAESSARSQPVVAKPPAKPTRYTVKAGDVLSTIAESTGVSLARIERLNPDVEAKSLHAGQQIKLAP